MATRRPHPPHRLTHSLNVGSVTHPNPLVAYQVAATVIPVLFAMIVFQARIFEDVQAAPHAPKHTRSVLYLVLPATLVNVVAGEAVALHVLHRGHSFSGSWGVVFWAIIWPTVWLIGVIVAPFTSRLRAELAEQPRAYNITLAASILYAALLAFPAVRVLLR